MPVRRLVGQAVLRRGLRRERVHRRQGPPPGARPARQLPGPAADHLRQPGHLPALGPVHRPAGHRVPHRLRAVRRPQRRPDGRAHPGRQGLPVRRLEPSLRRPRTAQPGRLAGQRERAIEITQDGPYRVTGGVPLGRRGGHGRAPRRRFFTRALRALPVRSLAEQAVLQRYALVRRVPRSGPPARRGADPVRVGGRAARADPDDPPAVRKARARRRPARAAIRHHGARAPGA